MAAARAPRQGILSLTIRDKSALYASYMPFIKNGGLFIPTDKPYKLGDEVFMLLTLMDSEGKLPLPARSSGSRPRARRATRRPGSACSSVNWTRARPKARSRPNWPAP